VGISRDGLLIAQVDRRLLPASVNTRSVRVLSGVVREPLAVQFDPVDVAIRAELRGGRLLEPQVTYRLVIEGVVDLDHRAMEVPFDATFRTAATSAGRPPVEPVSFSEVLHLVVDRCAGGSCHGPAEAALGLDLSSAEAIASTAIGVRSVQVSRGDLDSEGGRGSPVLTDLPIVDVVAGVGSPGNSYLLYKVLGDEHILGAVMPPSDSNRPALSREEARMLSRWIQAGAPVEP